MSPEEHPPVNDTSSEEESSDDSVQEEQPVINESSSDESDDEITPNEPATPLITNQSIPEVTEWLQDVHLHDMSVQGSTTGGNAGGASFKVNAPSEFSGQRNQVKTFKLQCLTYLTLNSEKLNTNRKKLLFLTSYLRGPAYEWILPHLEDYLEHTEFNELKDTTKVVMAGPTAFFNELQSTFGYGNEQMEAERALQTMVQRGPVSKYKAEFQTMVVKTSWDDHAIASHFYRGLKDVIKDEIARRETRPSTAREMYEVALKIDERIYERQMEKKGVYQGRANTKAQREVPAWKDNYYGLQRMQIDATKGKPGSNNKKQNKRPQPKTKGTADKSSVECYGCGKKGHYKNECKARKQIHDLQNSGHSKNGFRTTKGKTAESVENAKVSDETRVESMRATQGRGGLDTTGTIKEEQDSHAVLTWTACYDDGCAIHYSDKYGSGYWPQRKTRSVCRTIGQPIPKVRFVEGHPSPEDSSTEEESEQEESEPEQEPGQVVRYPAGYPPQLEESSEEEGEASETEPVEETVEVMEFTRTFYNNDPMLRLLEAVADSRPLLLPWDSEGRIQLVNENELWELFAAMRRILWDVPHEKYGTDYHRIVQEFPPLGSRFAPDGGYTTAENVHFTREMRKGVMKIKNDYAQELIEQRDRLTVSHDPRVSVYRRDCVAPIIPEEYGKEPEYVRKRPTTLQNRPPTPHVQAGTSAVLQRDTRMTSGYTVKPTQMTVENKSEYAVKRLLDSDNLGHRDRPGLHRPITPRRMPQPRDAGN